MCNPGLNCISRTAISRLSAAIVLVMGAVAGAQAAEKSSGSVSSEAAIRASAASFVKAFNRGDAGAVAALWTAHGTLADEQGQILQGRKAIQNEYAALFKAAPEARIEIAIQSIEFPTHGMAVEDGIATVVTKRGPPSASRYTAVHILQDGAWLMATVRETDIEVSSNYRQLQDLEWLVGQWEIKSEHATVHTTIRWIANKNFLQREYTVRQNDVTVSSGMQVIGWDPQSKQVHSWSFDASGGHGTGSWTATPEGWRINSTGVLSNGTPTSSQDFVIRVPGEDNVFGFRSVSRKVGATQLPDLGEVVLERVSEKH